MKLCHQKNDSTIDYAAAWKGLNIWEDEETFGPICMLLHSTPSPEEFLNKNSISPLNEKLNKAG
jgi:hypothetical protein